MPQWASTLTTLARSAIAERLQLPTAAVEASDPRLHEPGACFVTLTENGQLRGCIGSIEARRALLDDVRDNAIGAAFRDRRFAALTAREFTNTEVEVSVLSVPQPIAATTRAQALRELRPHEDGVVLEAPGRRATFLPQVWEKLPEPEAFLAQLERKAGLTPRAWQRGVQLSRYTVTSYLETS